MPKRTLSGSGVKPKICAVELDPVRRAVGADVLDDAEEIHARDRRRMRIDRRDRAEVDVVDREVVVTVDEIDEALADAVDRRNVELHRAGAHGDRPGAELERAPECGVGVAHPDRDRADDGPLDGLHGARHVGRLRVHDDVHRALPIELHLARAVPRDRPKAHRLQHPAQCLRLRCREFDELDARRCRAGYAVREPPRGPGCSVIASPRSARRHRRNHVYRISNRTHRRDAERMH